MRIFSSCGTHQKRPQFFIVGLGRGKRVMGHRHGDCLNPGKCVSDDVLLAGYVADVGGKMRDEIQMVELVWRALVPLLVESEGERFVVRQDGEMPGLQHVTEVPHGLVDCQEFPVVRTVF